jgi:membrane-anchored protein YejM (alkaline phosphatase superfamily)
MMRDFMSGQFKKPQNAATLGGIVNTPDDAEHLQTWLNNMIYQVTHSGIQNPWGTGFMTGDMKNIYFGIEVMKEFNPELMVINMTDIDIGHFDYTKYVNAIGLADYALYKLWDAIQTTPGMMNDTVLIVVPEHGRNQQPNSVIDQYGRYALDHNNDAMSREIFCLIAGPSGVVRQNNVISSVQGESVDVVPTIANILGFDTNIPGGILDGRILSEAFV